MATTIGNDPRWRDKSGNLLSMASGRPSRRHPNADAHFRAVGRYQDEHGPEARRRKAAERAEDAAERRAAEAQATIRSRAAIVASEAVMYY